VVGVLPGTLAGTAVTSAPALRGEGEQQPGEGAQPSWPGRGGPVAADQLRAPGPAARKVPAPPGAALRAGARRLGR